MSPFVNVAEFEHFYLGTRHRLLRYAYGLTGDLAEAQDAVQDAFCRAYERWARIGRYDNPVAWVRRVAWNAATTRLRRRRVARRVLLRPRLESVPGPDPDRVALTRALATLPERQRRVVVLHYLAHLTIAEIAAQESIAEGTVKSWLSRGRAALASQLKGGN